MTSLRSERGPMASAAGLTEAVLMAFREINLLLKTQEYLTIKI
jgi:hypothetical protein